MLLSVIQIFVDCNVAIRFCTRFCTRHKFVDCSFVIRRNFVDCSFSIRDNSIRDGICWGLVDVGHCRLMPLKALTLEAVLTKPLPMMTTPT